MKKLILILSLVCCLGLTSCLKNNDPRIVKSETEWMYTDNIYRIVKLDSIHYMMIVNYNMSGRLVRPIVFNKETGETISLDTDIK